MYKKPKDHLNLFQDQVPVLNKHVSHDVENSIKYSQQNRYGVTSPQMASLNIDNQFSYDDLNAAFTQASIHQHQINSSGYLAQQDYVLDTREEIQIVEQDNYEVISLAELLQHFPDLPSFICHEDFPDFSAFWIDFQKNISLAKSPPNRPFVQLWLESATLQIHNRLVKIVKKNHHTKDTKTEARYMFSAFRRLKDRIEIMHEVFKIIENGRTWLNQSPTDAIAPLIEYATKIKQDVSYFSDKNTNVIPLLDPNSNSLKIVGPEQVTMVELSNGVAQTYNITQCTKAHNKDDTRPTHNHNSCFNPEQQRLEPCDNFPSSSNGSTSGDGRTPSQYQLDGYDMFENLSFYEAAVTTDYIQPLWIAPPHIYHHYSSTSSLPPTPISNHPGQQFISLPTTPTHHRAMPSRMPTMMEETGLLYNTPEFSLLSPIYEATHASPLNMTSQQDESDPENSDWPLLSSSLEESPRSPVARGSSEDDYHNVSPNEEDEDDDYMLSDEDSSKVDEDYKAEKKKTSAVSKTRKMTQEGTKKVTIDSSSSSGSSNNQNLRKKELRNGAHSRGSSSYSRRTATSYDPQTTHYLKSVFFDIYSSKDKLSKDQRRQVHKETGLKPRNITYWFSNHKRRFQNSLLVYKKTIKESKGAVRTYDDFLNWRNAHGLSEEVMDDEYVEEEGSGGGDGNSSDGGDSIMEEAE